jgi:hypothetical protein
MAPAHLVAHTPDAWGSCIVSHSVRAELRLFSRPRQATPCVLPAPRRAAIARFSDNEPVDVCTDVAEGQDRARTHACGYGTAHQVRVSLRFPTPSDLTLRSVIDIGDAAGLGEPVPSFAPAFEKMWAGDAVECRTTGQKFYLPRPTVSLIDVRLLFQWASFL